MGCLSRGTRRALICLWLGAWACTESTEPTGAACNVAGMRYRSGARDVPDPVSCNRCRCSEGALRDCGTQDCPQPCPEGTTYGETCIDVGLADECLEVLLGCLPACARSSDCVGEMSYCHQGFCGHPPLP